MLRLLCPALLALALFAVPMLAVAQEATPASPLPPDQPACPSADYPIAGALSITDGAVKWFTCSPDEAYRTVIGANDDVVLIEESGPTGRRTIAFDAADGSERWRRSTANTPTPPGPLDGQGIIVLADQDALALVGVDSATGEKKWRVESGEVPLAHSASVAVVWVAVEVGLSSRFRGIDRVTGDELWVSDTPLLDRSGIFVARSPAAVLGEVVAVPTGATFTAIDMRTGAVLWQAPQIDHLGAADGIIVGIRGSNRSAPVVVAIDAISGQELWTAPGRSSYGGLLAVGDRAIVVLDVDSPGLVAYELSSGDERWRAVQTTYVEPQLISGMSLVSLWEGELSVMSTTNGAAIWSATQPFRSPLMNSVGSNGGSVFVAINSLQWRD